MNKKIIDRVHKTQIKILDEIDSICNTNKIDYFLIGGTLLGAIRHGGFIPWDDDIDIAMPRDSYNKFIQVCENYLSAEYELDYSGNNSRYWLPLLKVRKKGTVYAQEFQDDDENVPQGIWVDIFPLDNVKYENSLLQTIQAKLVYLLRAFILYKQGYVKTVRRRNKILFTLFKNMSISTAFQLQEKIMTVWNNNDTLYFVSLASRYGYKKQTILKDKYVPSTKLKFEGKFYNAPNDSNYILKRVYGDYMKLPPEDKRVTHNPVRLKFEGEDEIIF